MKFVRVGGLSSVKYHRMTAESKGYSYPPPRRKGIYAFIWPYLVPFFYAWKISKVLERKGIETYDSERDCQTRAYNEMLRAVGIRQFYYEGPIWTHLGTESWEDSWQEVNTITLTQLLKREHINLSKELMRDYTGTSWGARSRPISECLCDNPFKRGRNGMFSKDHLEVFIEKKFLGRVR